MIQFNVFKVVLGFAVLAHTFSAFAGMSSAGEFTFKPIISCNAETIDPTFPTATQRVDVVKETDWDGNIVWDNPSLTMVTYGADGEVLLYHPLDEEIVIEYPTVLPQFIDVFRYRPGSEGNENLGSIVFESRVGPSNGQVSSNSQELEELLLSDCAWVVDAQ